MLKRTLAAVFAAATAISIACPAAITASYAHAKPEHPQIEKLVQEDRDGSWGQIADFDAGQEIPYKVEVTLPSDISSYDEYEVTVIDKWDGSLSIDTSSIRMSVVSADGKAVPADAKYELEGSTAIEIIDDVLSHGVNAPEKLVIEYTMSFSSKATPSTEMPNDVWMKYPFRQPNGSISTETSEKSRCEVYTWQVEMMKADSETGKALEGVPFAIRRVDDKMIRTVDGRWVKEWDASKCCFTTDEAGVLSISGLDEGEYEVVEAAALSGYELPGSPLSAAISSSLSSPGKASHSQKVDGSWVKSGEDGKPIALNTPSKETPEPDPRPSETPTPSGTPTSSSITTSTPKSPFNSTGGGTLVKTGDTATAVAIVAGIAIAGGMLVALGIIAKKRDDGEK